MTHWTNTTETDLIVHTPDADYIIPPKQSREIPSEHDAFVASAGIAGLTRESAKAAPAASTKPTPKASKVDDWGDGGSAA